MNADYYRPLLDNIRDLAITFGGSLREAIERDDPDALAAALDRIVTVASIARAKITIVTHLND